jgi:outer membrane receptor protein involved in Fe transport
LKIFHLRPALALLLATPGSSVGLAQSVPNPAPAGPSGAASATETIVLSPFEVSTSNDRGYAASSALSGTRTNEKLANLPNSISVFTADLLSDLAITDFFGAVDFAVGAENQYNNQGTIGAPVGSRSGNQINFRGIPSIRQLRDGYPWFLPSDTYNTERIEIARGPGGLAYGDVDPSGIINISTKRASFRRTGNATVRYDNFGSQRYALDVNQPLAPRLGVRLNVLDSELEQSRQRNNRDYTGLAGALRWDPFKHGRTRFEIAYERGRTTQQLRHLQLNDAITAYVRGSGTNAADADAARAGVQVNGVGMRRTAAPGNTHSYVDIGGTIHDLQSTATNTFRNSATITAVGADVGADPQNPRLVPLLPVPFSIIPETQDWGGPDNRADARFTAYTIELSHAFSDRLRVLVSHNAQIDDSSRPQTYSSSPALGINARAVFIDVNRVLPHPTIPNATIPNPRFEELFIAHGPTLATDGHDIAGWRGSAVIDPPLPIRDATLRLVAAASYRREHVYLNTFNYALAREEITRRGLAGAAATFPNNLLYPVHYLADGNSDEELSLRLEPGVTGWYRTSANNLRFDQTLGSGSLSTLGSFFKGRLHTSVGVSRDYFRQNRNRNNVTSSVTGEVQLVDREGVVIANPSNFNFPVVPVARSYATNQTYGGVFRVLPWLGLGAGYFESTLFTDSAGTDLRGLPREPRTGEGHEYSLRLTPFDERISATLTRFETVAENNAVAISAPALAELNTVLPPEARLIGTGDYRDQSTKGWEFELQTNLTRTWTLRASYSTNRVIYTRFFPLTRPRLAQAREAASASGLNPDLATEITAQLLADQEGAISAVRRETANIATRYSFEQGPLKGFAVGVSARYALGLLRAASPGNVVAGYELYPNGRTDDYVLVNPFFTYRRKLAKLAWLFQLNVNNAFDLRSNHGNSWTWPRYLEPRQFIYTATVRF